MLVLSRKKHESIIIGDGLITVTVLEIRGDKVRLGIDAPRDVNILRTELTDEPGGKESNAKQTLPG